jgi:23S rRNA pseudouridine2605 synthase
VATGVVELTIREGKKRQVRRMLEAVGHRVVELERVAFGPLGLRGLEPGKSRRLTKAEVERLRRGTEPRERAPAGRGGRPGARGPAAGKPGATPARSGAGKPGPKSAARQARSGAGKPARTGAGKPGSKPARPGGQPARRRAR